MNKSISIFLLLFLVSISGSFAQKNRNMPVGIVDVNVIAAQLPESKEADTELQNFQKKISDSLAVMQQNFQKRVESYVKQKSMMKLEEQQKQEAAFQAEQQQLIALREKMLQELNDKRDKLLKPIRDKITQAISQVAKEEKLKLVLDKSSAVVLYSEDKMDITFKVLDMIKRGKK